MSKWVHMTLTAEVEVGDFLSPEAVKAQVETEFKYGTGITGSEGEAKLYVVPLESRITGFRDDGRPIYKFDQAIIVVHGHLRDVTIKDARYDIRQFEKKLKKYCRSIRDFQYAIWDDENEPCWYQ